MCKRLTFFVFFAWLTACQNATDNPNAVSFLTFGDWGTGGVHQWVVSLEMEKYCKYHECEFVVTLGDNFYEQGITAETEDQWITKFERMYHHLNIPFYAILGNHDMEG